MLPAYIVGLAFALRGALAALDALPMLAAQTREAFRAKLCRLPLGWIAAGQAFGIALHLTVLVVVGAWFVLQIEPLQKLLAIGTCEPMSWPAILAGFASGALLSPVCLRRQRAADSDARTTRTDNRPTRRPSSSKGK